MIAFFFIFSLNVLTSKQLSIISTNSFKSAMHYYALLLLSCYYYCFPDIVFHKNWSYFYLYDNIISSLRIILTINITITTTTTTTLSTSSSMILAFIFYHHYYISVPHSIQTDLSLHYYLLPKLLFSLHQKENCPLGGKCLWVRLPYSRSEHSVDHMIALLLVKRILHRFFSLLLLNI